MNNWIKHPTILKGQLIDLIPMDESHFDELLILSQDKRIWEFYPVDGSNTEKLLIAYKNALIEKEKGNHYPFVIFHKETGKLIGSTRLFEINQKNKNIEIGWTWLHPNYWASGVNFECKLLLLTFCFETLGTIRVQLKTRDNNLRSRKAIEKIGGKFEGILRKDRIRDNGEVRNSAYYSILDDEWKNVKQNLEQKIYEKTKTYL